MKGKKGNNDNHRRAPSSSSTDSTESHHQKRARSLSGSSTSDSPRGDQNVGSSSTKPEQKAAQIHGGKEGRRLDTESLIAQSTHQKPKHEPAVDMTGIHT